MAEMDVFCNALSETNEYNRIYRIFANGQNEQEQNEEKIYTKPSEKLLSQSSEDETKT